MADVRTNIGRDDEYSFTVAGVFHSEIDLAKWLLRMAFLGGRRAGIKVRFSASGSTAIRPISQIVSDIAGQNPELEALVSEYVLRENQKQARLDLQR